MSGLEPAPVAVVTAMPEELRAICRRARRQRPAGGGFVRARLGGTEVVLAPAGEGAKKAERGVEALWRAFRPAALVGAGVAGGLTPRLAAGDLLVSRRVRDRAGEAPAPDQGLLSRALRAGGAVAGALVTVERPAVSAQEKKRLAGTLADGEPGTVDLESAAWARAAAAHRIPYLIVRAVSDEAREELPEYLARCVGEDGSVRRLAVLARGLARPATIPALLRMRRRVAEGAEALALFLERLLAEGA